MPTVKLDKAVDLFVHGRAVINEAKQHVVSTLAQDAAKQIKAKSNGRMRAELSYKQHGFVVGEPLSPDDPDGKKVLKAESETQAYAQTYRQLLDKGYVLGVIK